MYGIGNAKKCSYLFNKRSVSFILIIYDIQTNISMQYRPEARFGDVHASGGDGGHAASFLTHPARMSHISRQRRQYR